MAVIREIHDCPEGHVAIGRSRKTAEDHRRGGFPAIAGTYPRQNPYCKCPPRQSQRISHFSTSSYTFFPNQRQLLHSPVSDAESFWYLLAVTATKKNKKTWDT